MYGISFILGRTAGSYRTRLLKFLNIGREISFFKASYNVFRDTATVVILFQRFEALQYCRQRGLRTQNFGFRPGSAHRNRDDRVRTFFSFLNAEMISTVKLGMLNDYLPYRVTNDFVKWKRLIDCYVELMWMNE